SDDLTVQPDDDLRERRRDEQEEDAGDGCQPDRWQRGTRLEPDRQRERAQGQRPGDPDDGGLDDRQREVDRDVEHVAPARLVGELGTDDVDDAAAERPIRVGSRLVGFADGHPPALDPGHDARTFDARRDEQEADSREQRREPGRDKGHDDAERQRRDEWTDDDRADRVPGLRMDRREQEGLERGARDPRSSEGRSTGDPCRAEPGEDEQQPCRQDDRFDPSADSVGSSAVALDGVSRRRLATTRRPPMPTTNAGPRYRHASMYEGRTESSRARPPNRISTR